MPGILAANTPIINTHNESVPNGTYDEGHSVPFGTLCPSSYWPRYGKNKHFLVLAWNLHI
jgi:hypothetical protein